MVMFIHVDVPSSISVCSLFAKSFNSCSTGVVAMLCVMTFVSSVSNHCLVLIPLINVNECLCVQLLVNQLEPLTEQQLVGITNLQQSSQQAEDALSQGMEALQQSLAETLSSGSLGSSGSSGNVANYMGQMAMAMGKLGTLEGFIRQVIPYSFFFQLFVCKLVTTAT